MHGAYVNIGGVHIVGLTAEEAKERQSMMKESFNSLSQKRKEAQELPIEQLSEVLEAQVVQMAVDHNWTVDAPIHVLSQQGLGACYREFLGTLRAPPEMGAQDFDKRMHQFGLSLFSFFLSQEAFENRVGPGPNPVQEESSCLIKGEVLPGVHEQDSTSLFVMPHHFKGVLKVEEAMAFNDKPAW